MQSSKWLTPVSHTRYFLNREYWIELQIQLLSTCVKYHLSFNRMLHFHPSLKVNANPASLRTVTTYNIPATPLFRQGSCSCCPSARFCIPVPWKCKFIRIIHAIATHLLTGNRAMVKSQRILTTFLFALSYVFAASLSSISHHEPSSTILATFKYRSLGRRRCFDWRSSWCVGVLVCSWSVGGITAKICSSSCIH